MLFGGASAAVVGGEVGAELIAGAGAGDATGVELGTAVGGERAVLAGGGELGAVLAGGGEPGAVLAGGGALEAVVSLDSSLVVSLARGAGCLNMRCNATLRSRPLKSSLISSSSAAIKRGPASPHSWSEKILRSTLLCAGSANAESESNSPFRTQPCSLVL